VFLVPAAVGTLLIAFVVGALSQVGRGSGPAHRTIDRGFAALASIVAARSHATGLSVAELFVNAPHLDRLAFFSSLAAITSQSADEARQLDAAVPPEPLDGAGEGCLAAVQARASATAVIKQSLEGLLGGSDGTSSVSPAQSLASLEAAATTVVQADADWSSCRGAMRRAPGSARVPASAWLAGQGWFTPAALASSVNSVALSRTLAAHHALAVIATNVVPASLPAPSAGPALVAPTKTLMVHVVVTDDGNVAEPAVQVRAVLTGGPSPTALGATVALQAGTSTAVVLGPFSVVPGAAYTVQVLVASSSGAAAASVGKALQVVSEPTSTTTVVTTTTTSTPKHQGIRRSGG
jgi:hypothetical protein